MWYAHLCFYVLCFSQAQFIFLHDTILEHAQCGTTLVVQVPQLSKMIQMLDAIDSDNSKTGFYKLWKFGIEL